MKTLVRTVALVLCGTLTACAPSGYSLQVRNNLGQPADLKIQAQKDDSEARTLEALLVAPGQTVTHHTRAERKEKVTLEARVQGDVQSPPATYPMGVGLSKVVINPNPEGAKDAKKPKARIVEERD